jgi:hypothetical protein
MFHPMKKYFHYTLGKAIFGVALCRQVPIGFVTKQLIQEILQLIGLFSVRSSKTLPYPQSRLPRVWVDTNWVSKNHCPSASSLRSAQRCQESFLHLATSVVQLLFWV